MQEKVWEMLVSTYIKGKQWTEEMKTDERALSGIVVAIMLSLVAVVVAVTFKKELSSFISTLWQKITQDAQGFK